MTNVSILISGGGSNMVALVEDMADQDHPGIPAMVLSNVPDAVGLDKAAALGVPTRVIDHRDYDGDRRAFDSDLHHTLVAARTDFICLAGFMRILTPEFVDAWQNRMINIHPSLLPAYPGLNTHARALENGDKEAGCTVHSVTADLDAGPILGQARVAVQDGDDAETLASRVLEMEHKLYPAVLRRVLSDETDPLYLPA